MEEKEVINEGVANTISEEVSKSNGNVIAKVAIIAIAAIASVGGIILYKRHKRKLQEVDAENVETDYTIDNDAKNNEN